MSFQVHKARVATTQLEHVTGAITQDTFNNVRVLRTKYFI
jgi:hypothetical protein